MIGNEEIGGIEEIVGNETVVGNEEIIGNEEVIEDVTEDIIEESLSHITCNWDEGSIVSQANCLVEGSKIYICSVCGITRQEAISRTEHNFVTEIMEATCLENGMQKKYCTLVGMKTVM